MEDKNPQYHRKIENTTNAKNTKYTLIIQKYPNTKIQKYKIPPNIKNLQTKQQYPKIKKKT